MSPSWPNLYEAEMLDKYALIGMTIAALFLGYFVGVKLERGKQDAALVSQLHAARAAEQKLQEQIDATAKQTQIDMAAITHARDAAINELRKRPVRLPADARASITGADGRGLSSEDAGFLIGEAASAQRRVIALRACYSVYDAVRHLIKP